jgi:hypothetical protein
MVVKEQGVAEDRVLVEDRYFDVVFLADRNRR